MYTTINFRSKKAVKDAVTAGDHVTIFQYNDLWNNPEGAPTYTGISFIEGPHYPAPHQWYAKVDVKEGRIVKVY